MSISKRKFADLLTEGIHRIRLREHKTVQIVQDELGYALGREGGSALEYWRKGHIPTKLAEIEKLAREMVPRGQLEQPWLEKFLRSAGHPNLTVLCEEMFPSSFIAGSPTMAPRQAQDILQQLPPVAKLPSFVAGPPILHPYQFFGRERNLKRLFNLWKQTPLQNAAIIGPRRAGKTSLLHYLRTVTLVSKTHLRPGQVNTWLADPKRYRWIFIDFQDPRLGTRNGLLKYLLTELNLPVGDSCELDDFLDVVSQHLAQPTIILLDEIGVALERYTELDDAFWEGLRSLATNQVGGQLGFVLSSHKAPQELAWQNDLGSPFFNIFGYTTTIGPLTETETEGLIANSPQPFAQSEVDWILKMSQRWPILLQILCREYLFALEEGEHDKGWREDALNQIEPFKYLLAKD